MARIDKIKEVLNSLRVGLSIISAFIITLGGVLGNFYNKEMFSLLFWITFGLIIVFIVSGFVIIHKIKTKTNELEDL
jgi:ABC-type bacteriocin/lantibiotic exporter with double-glycine peptidase domain